MESVNIQLRDMHKREERLEREAEFKKQEILDDPFDYKIEEAINLFDDNQNLLEAVVEEDDERAFKLFKECREEFKEAWQEFLDGI